MSESSAFMVAYTMLTVHNQRDSGEFVVLCHGTAISTRTQLPFPTAWIEEREPTGVWAVRDVHQPEIRLNKVLYYNTGKIDPKAVRIYNWWQAKQLYQKTRHFGPWTEEKKG